MTDLETLRQQVPFDLIPTNIPNVYTLPTPPEGIDPTPPVARSFANMACFCVGLVRQITRRSNKRGKKSFRTSGDSMIEFFRDCSRNSERHII